MENSGRGSSPRHIISILSELPWVQEVNLRKHWSLGSILEISPKNVIAYWNDDSFIANDGVVLKGNLFRAGSLPYFYGPKGSEKNLIDLLFNVLENCQLARYTPLNIEAMSEDYENAKLFIEQLEKVKNEK